jgi:hypothetical protein
VRNSAGGEGTEVAEIPFSLHFSDNPPSGNLTKIKIRINFDATALSYTGAEATANWPGVINEDPQAHDHENGVICLEFVEASGVSIPTSPTQYATLTFEADCQEELNVTDIAFDQNSNDNFVDTYDGSTSSYSPQNFDDGTVTIVDYQATYEISDVTAYLGDTDVAVPISGTTNFNMYGVVHTVEFDFTKLSFAGGVIDSTAFPNPSEYSHFVETEPGRLEIMVYSSVQCWTPPIEDQTLYSLKFDVKADHEGFPNGDDYTVSLDFDFDNCWVLVYYSENAIAWCSFLATCIDPDDYINGSIDVPPYSAELLSESAASYIAKTGNPTQEILFDVFMLNSFPAGDYAGIGKGGVHIVFDLPDHLSHHELVEDPGTPNFITMEWMNGERILYAYQQYGASVPSNFWPPTTESVTLFHEYLTFDEQGFAPDYDNRWIGPAFRSEFVGDQCDWHSLVEDTTGAVSADSANGKLTWESIPAEVRMGEFCAPYVETEERYLYQPVYIRANFDIGEFSVNISVDGDFDIESVQPEMTDVEYQTISATEVRIYFDEDYTFHTATGNDQLLIATVEYLVDCHGTRGFGKVLPKPPPRPWIPHIVKADISLDYESMEDDAGNDHFVALVSDSIKSYYCADEIMKPSVDFASTPPSYQLHANYPNPFNPETTIEYSLTDPEHVRIDIYNILGNRVSTLVDEVKAPGNHEVMWNGTDENGSRVASGIYFYNMKAGAFNETRRMVMLK